MDVHIISPDCVAFLTRPEDAPDRDAAADLVRKLLSERGLPPWSAIELDMFVAEDEALVLAKPAGVWVPGYALNFLQQKND